MDEKVSHSLSRAIRFVGNGGVKKKRTRGSVMKLETLKDNPRARAHCLECGEIKPFKEMDWIECNREGVCKSCKSK